MKKGNSLSSVKYTQAFEDGRQQGYIHAKEEFNKQLEQIINQKTDKQYRALADICQAGTGIVECMVRALNSTLGSTTSYPQMLGRIHRAGESTGTSLHLEEKISAIVQSKIDALKKSSKGKWDEL